MPSDEVNDTPVSNVAPAADKAVPAVLGPVLGLLQSRKALVMLVAVITAGVLIGLGKATVEQGGIFIAAVIGVWMNSHAKEEAGKAQAGGGE